VSAEAICQLVTAFVALAAFFGTGTICLMRGDEFLYAVLKAGGSLIGIVIVLRYLASMLQGGWIGPPQRPKGESANRPGGSNR
jgi:hypothetical protein